MRAYPSATPEEVQENKMLKDRFALFIRNRAMTLSLKNSSDYRSLTFTELLTRAQDYQASVLLTQQAYDGKAVPSSIQEMEERPMEEEEEKIVQQITAQMHRTEPSTAPRTNFMTCYHCNEKGHGIKDCNVLNKALERIRRKPQTFGLALANRGGPNRTPNTTKGNLPRRGAAKLKGRGKGKSPYYTFQMMEEDEEENDDEEEENASEN